MQNKNEDIQVILTLANNDTVQHTTDDLGKFLNEWQQSGFRQFSNRIIPFHALVSVLVIPTVVFLEAPKR